MEAQRLRYDNRQYPSTTRRHFTRQSIPHELLQEAESKYAELQPFYLQALRKILNETLPDKTTVLSESVPRDVLSKEEMNVAFIGMHYFAVHACHAAFSMLIELAHQEKEFLDACLGDALTEEFDDIVYFTFDPDDPEHWQLLKDLIYDETANEYARADGLYVLGQLWEDGQYSTRQWKETLLDLVNNSRKRDDAFYTNVVDEMARCHFHEFTDLIREKIENHEIDLQMCGDYAEHLDIMYAETPPEFIHKPFDVEGELGRWYSITGREKFMQQENRKHPEDLTKAYLLKALDRVREDCDNGHYPTPEAYDEKHMIHYATRTWMEKSIEVLEDTHDDTALYRVKEEIKSIGWSL